MISAGCVAAARLLMGGVHEVARHAVSVVGFLGGNSNLPQLPCMCGGMRGGQPQERMHETERQ